ncbi:MAG: patatin-like phospholipase family protein [Rhodospirillales bacterium]|nr:patatin-like phospholipase family protein [Rhodospirillales bacterium]MDE2574903.1 patatin-like phospholipase family protein [Rhodospirillales bacterium]
MAKAKAAGTRPVDKRVALVLQGGGALGSYQAGVYDALEEGGYLPDWVAGISIGAINAAIIAGNAPARRTEQLRAFWEQVSSLSAMWPDLPLHAWQQASRQAGALAALVFGQPGFFRPNAVQAWISGRPATSYYDTSELRGTLERLVDFDRINAREIRLSVGAVNVRTGNFRYFDNRREPIRPEHVMASGALPPGFPGIEIEGELYWDGGLVSNTPLQHVLDDYPRESTLAFQVDLFPAQGALPHDLESVEERRKDIQYSSRTRLGVDSFRTAHNMRRAMARLYARLPPALRDTPEGLELERAACMTSMDVVHLIYRSREAQGAAKDFEFSRATMQARWGQGLADGMAALTAAPWLAPASPEIAVRTFDVRHAAEPRAGGPA